MLLILFTSALVALPMPQDGTIAADRATYDDLVKCAGVHQASLANAWAEGAILPDEQMEASRVAFQHLAYLYGAPLGKDATVVDAEIDQADRSARAPRQMARTDEGLAAARRGLEMDRRICAAVMTRISGTS